VESLSPADFQEWRDLERDLRAWGLKHKRITPEPDVIADPDWRAAVESWRAQQAPARPGSAGRPPRGQVKIPPNKRTRPMSYREAARLMGKGDSRDAAEWLSAAVEDGTVVCEHFSRQTHVFSLDDFPANVRPRILPR
jgi:hypothetical protein